MFNSINNKEKPNWQNDEGDIKYPQSISALGSTSDKLSFKIGGGITLHAVAIRINKLVEEGRLKHRDASMLLDEILEPISKQLTEI